MFPVIIEYQNRGNHSIIFECIDLEKISWPTEGEWSIEDVIEHVSDIRNIRIFSMLSISDFRLRMLKEARRELAINRAIKRLGGNHIIFTEFAYHDYDGIRKSLDKTTVRKVLDEILDIATSGDIAKIKTIHELGEWYENLFDYDPMTFFGTEKDWEHRKAEKERKEIESFASTIAKENNIKTNSLEFLNVVDNLLKNVSYEKERWNDGETRMEEWAAHMYAGSRDAYFDDLNFENSRYASRQDKLENILNWVSENCPLLWAKYEESKLAEEDADEDYNE